VNQHFITEIEIKNFKCFDNFKTEGFKRVNLIGGKNNVGKTAFMEAVYVNTKAIDLKSFVAALDDIKFMRENLNILGGYENDVKKNIEQFNNIFTKSNINLASYTIEDINGVKKYIFNFNGENIEVNVNQFSYERSIAKSIVFIDNFGLSNNQIIGLYASVQKKNEEYFLDEILKEFDSRIESFKIIDNKPQCEINGKYYEITEFGDGVRHLVSIITTLFFCEDGYLFIDEVDNGFHYTKLDELWKIILEVSDKLNVQVFATTHSKECIESFNRVQKKLNDSDTSYFEMIKNIKNKNIYMRVLDAKQLEYELTHGGEYRG